MTSMPASRRARAMIFAPRSCPSKPGLATTTRILPLDAASTAGGDATRRRLSEPYRPALEDRGHPRRGAGFAPDRDRRSAVARRGLHVARGVGARAGRVLR